MLYSKLTRETKKFTLEELLTHGCLGHTIYILSECVIKWEWTWFPVSFWYIQYQSLASPSLTSSNTYRSEDLSKIFLSISWGQAEQLDRKMHANRPTERGCSIYSIRDKPCSHISFLRPKLQPFWRLIQAIVAISAPLARRLIVLKWKKTVLSLNNIN